MSPQEVLNQIRNITSKLIELGLSNEQNFPILKTYPDRIIKVSISGDPNFTIGLKDIDYAEIYIELEKSKSFNVRLVDGGLLQYLYKFENGEIVEHRLAYFPAPDLKPFQVDYEIYIEDEIYADILNKNVVTFPIRFDFNADLEKYIDIFHPKSHLTLGQYQNCRIPVTSPLTPIAYTKFILRNFYNTAYKLYENELNIAHTDFPKCISNNEESIPHLNIGII